MLAWYNSTTFPPSRAGSPTNIRAYQGKRGFQIRQRVARLFPRTRHTKRAYDGRSHTEATHIATCLLGDSNKETQQAATPSLSTSTSTVSFSEAKVSYPITTSAPRTTSSEYSVVVVHEQRVIGRTALGDSPPKSTPATKAPRVKAGVRQVPSDSAEDNFRLRSGPTCTATCVEAPPPSTAPPPLPVTAMQFGLVSSVAGALALLVSSLTIFVHSQTHPTETTRTRTRRATERTRRSLQPSRRTLHQPSDQSGQQPSDHISQSTHRTSARSPMSRGMSKHAIQSMDTSNPSHSRSIPTVQFGNPDDESTTRTADLFRNNIQPFDQASATSDDDKPSPSTKLESGSEASLSATQSVRLDPTPSFSSQAGRSDGQHRGHQSGDINISMGVTRPMFGEISTSRSVGPSSQPEQTSSLERQKGPEMMCKINSASGSFEEPDRLTVHSWDKVAYLTPYISSVSLASREAAQSSQLPSQNSEEEISSTKRMNAPQRASEHLHHSAEAEFDVGRIKGDKAVDKA